MVGVSNSLSLLLRREQEAEDLWSAESLAGYLTETEEDDFEHVLKLECWYEYTDGPLAGTIRRTTGASARFPPTMASPNAPPASVRPA